MTLSNPTWIPQQPWKGGLVDRGLSFPDGVEWRTGVRFNSTGCVTPLLQDACAPTGEKTPTGIGDEREFLPTNVVQPVECATIGNIDLERLARERLETTTEYALGEVLALDPLTLGNPKLTDAVPTEYGCAKEALAATLAIAAVNGRGTRLTVHANVSAAVHLAHEMVLIDWVDWIVSPGYETAPQTAGPQIWVTGPTYVGVEDQIHLSGTLQVQNTKQEIAERVVLAAFDPCVLVSGTFPNDCGTP